jgi:Ca2+-binding EF-hand superfamily protein
MRRTTIIAAIAIAALAGPAIAQDFDLMGFADTDKNGKVSAEEFAVFQEQGWGFLSNGAESIKLADVQPQMKAAFNGVTPDASGAITHASYTAGVPARFKAADKDGDGSLSKAELEALFPAPPAG